MHQQCMTPLGDIVCPTLPHAIAAQLQEVRRTAKAMERGEDPPKKPEVQRDNDLVFHPPARAELFPKVRKLGARKKMRNEGRTAVKAVDGVETKQAEEVDQVDRPEPSDSSTKAVDTMVQCLADSGLRDGSPQPPTSPRRERHLIQTTLVFPTADGRLLRPTQSPTPRQIADWKESVRLTFVWARDEFRNTPKRTTPLLFTDANTGMGKRGI